MNIAFWKTRTGSYVSNLKGLSHTDTEVMKKLTIDGAILGLVVNYNKKHPKAPDMYLTLFRQDANPGSNKIVEDKP